MTALEELREAASALSQLNPQDSLWSAHLLIALANLARRVDELEARLGSREAA